MIFFKDIIFPIVLLLVTLFLILFALNLILRFFGIDIPILKFAGLIAIWYYIGPIMYNWLVEKIVTVPHEGIEIIYTPIQSILEALQKLV